MQLLRAKIDYSQRVYADTEVPLTQECQRLLIATRLIFECTMDCRCLYFAVEVVNCLIVVHSRRNGDRGVSGTACLQPGNRELLFALRLVDAVVAQSNSCLLYTSPSPRD